MAQDNYSMFGGCRFISVSGWEAGIFCTDLEYEHTTWQNINCGSLIFLTTQDNYAWLGGVQYDNFCVGLFSISCKELNTIGNQYTGSI